MTTATDTESIGNGDVTREQEKKKKPWVSYLWDTFDKPPEERKLLSKLDAAILSFASIGYFVKSIDQVCINNAFVSGMKEDMGLYQNQLNYMQAAYSLGYMVGQLPSNIILTRTRPKYWIPSLEITWSILTLALSRCDQAYQFYVIRFFVGLAESGYYPGIQYMIGSWYRRDELGKRSCIFQVCSAFGHMVSGYLMAGVYHLGGVGGYKGWQWLFLIDGLISLPLAIIGYFIIPDVPEITTSWYLNEKEIALAQKRMELEGRKPRSKYTKAKIKRIFSSWHIYALSLLYTVFNNSLPGGQPIFQQYLRSSTDPKYSITQINSYPTLTSAVHVVATIVSSWLSDTVLKGRRWPPIVFGGFFSAGIYVSLAIWEIPHWWKWTCYIGMGLGFGYGGLIMAWANEVCEDDSEERAITLATMNEVAYMVQFWLPLIVWQQVSAPRYHKGFITAACLSVCLVGVCFLVRSLHNKELARKPARLAENQGQESSSSEQGQQDDEKQKRLMVSELELTKTKMSTSYSSSSSSSSPSSSTRDRHADRNGDIAPHSPAEVEGEMSIEMEARPAKIC